MVKTKQKRGKLNSASRSKSTADFKHLKGKVGKKAPDVLSKTNTSFKSRKLYISEQSILADTAAGELTSAKGFSLVNLVTQLRHYSPNSKRDALSGLRSLFERNEGLASLKFSYVVESSLECLKNEDSSLRTALLEFFDYLLGFIDDEIMTPFADLFLAYTIGSMTDLSESIRKDGIAMLTILLNKFPKVFATRGHKLWSIFPALLTLDPASGKTSTRYLAATCFANLMQVIVGDNSAQLVDSSINFNDNRELEWKVDSSSNGIILVWHFHVLYSNSSILTELSNASTSSLSNHSSSSLSSEFSNILTRLLDLWMDSLNSETTQKPVLNHLQLVLDAVLLSSQFSVRHNFSVNQWVESSFLHVLMETFPLQGECESLGNELPSRLLVMLNISACELILCSDHNSTSYKPAALQYVNTLLEESSNFGGPKGLVKLLNILRVILFKNFQEPELEQARRCTLDTFGVFYENLIDENDAKATCLLFICKLLQAELGGKMINDGALEYQEDHLLHKLCTWARTFPSLLPPWCKDRPHCVHIALHTFLELARRTPKSCSSPTPDYSANESPLIEFLIWLPDTLIDLFKFEYFSLLPWKTQQLGASLLQHLPLQGFTLSTMSKSISKVCGNLKTCNATRGLLLDAMYCHRFILSPSWYLTLLLDVVNACLKDHLSKALRQGKCSVDIKVILLCDEVFKDVCDRVGKVAKISAGDSILQAMAPRLKSFLSEANLGICSFRFVTAVLLHLKSSIPDDPETDTVSNLLLSLAQSAVSFLREKDAHLATLVHLPLVHLLRQFPSFILKLCKAVHAVIQKCAALEQMQLLTAMQGFVRKEFELCRVENLKDLQSIVCEIGKFLAESPAQELSRQLQVDVDVLIKT